MVYHIFVVYIWLNNKNRKDNAPVIDVMKAGYIKVFGKGNLFEHQ